MVVGKLKENIFYLLMQDDWIQSNVLQYVYDSLEKDELDILVMDFQYWDEKGKLPKEFNRVSDEKVLSAQVWSGTVLCNSFCHKWSGAMLIEPLSGKNIN